jgi:hypothetical protein
MNHEEASTTPTAGAMQWKATSEDYSIEPEQNNVVEIRTFGSGHTVSVNAIQEAVSSLCPWPSARKFNNLD